MAYVPELLRKRIDTTLFESATELDLSAVGTRGNFVCGTMAEIPPEVFNLTKLRVLKLRGHRITHVPDAICNLVDLQELDLSKNYLQTLPESITRLSNLTQLDVSWNSLTTLPESITQLSNLTQLDVSYNSLKTLPESITHLSNLTQLDVSGNRLATLPKTIAQMSNLTQLDVSKNNLMTLPESIMLLSNLTSLNVSGNTLATLLDSITRLHNLTQLNVSENNLMTLSKAVARLSNLTSLNVSGNTLATLPESITQLGNLTQLDVSENNLMTLPESVTQLSNLTSLDVSGNTLATLPESITRLGNLTQLNVSGNKLIRLPESITHLSNLTQLDVSGNRLATLPESIMLLSNLTSLDVSGNTLATLPESITRLGNLTQLNVSENNLMRLPESVTQLSNLTSLDVSGNRLATLPESITRLGNLTQLNVSENNLMRLPESITHLSNLTQLDVSGNRLATLPESITRLDNLTQLNVSENNLMRLPESVTQLSNLTSLDVSGNTLTTLPESITRLDNLTQLNVSDNFLKTLSESITRLSNLTHLDASGNNLTTMPESIALMTNLAELVIHTNDLPFPREDRLAHRKIRQRSSKKNQILDAPDYLLNLFGLKELHIDASIVVEPPPEIVVGGLEAMRAYCAQRQKTGADYLYEAKLLVLGESGAGKTSIAHKIMNPSYKLREEEPSTKGIEVMRWLFRMENGKDFRVNIWDFGGQEVYHATHQYFLTKRSLYLLIADTRKEDTDFYYWLNIVELLSNNSPLLIVKNEKQDRHREINERQLRGQFTSLKEVLPTNLATNRDLDTVVASIKHYISHLPHIGTPLPKTWVRVRESLENDSRNYIPLQEFLDVCDANGFTQLRDKLQLSGYLHDLGICLHFQEDPLLRRIVILKPKWGTDAAYKVLDNPKVIHNLGRFTDSDLAHIWGEEEYASMRPELLRLMINFKLCYELPGKSGTYIAPQMLSINQPDYEWDAGDNLHLRYSYEFMPKGIVTRLIVAMNSCIERQVLVWKAGVVLTRDNARAEVIEYYEKKEIQIRVSGRRKRDLLTLVMYEIDQINGSYQQLRFAKRIPCNCDNCRAAAAPYFYEFNNLTEFVEKGRSQIQCHESGAMVAIAGLIDDVIDSAQLDQLNEQKAQQERSPYLIISEVEQLIVADVNGPSRVQIARGGNNTMSEKTNQSDSQIKSAWASGSFYLFVFIVVIAGLGALANFVPWYAFALILVAGVIFVPLIGALQLRQDDRLSEKSFLDLVKIVLKQLPIIGNAIK